MAIAARLDHVAVAVPSIDAARATLVEPFGARLVMRYPHDDRPFNAEQHRFGNDAKLELIEPNPRYVGPDPFLHRFVERRGTSIHHLTLKVPEVAAVLSELADAGLDLVGVSIDDRPNWQEAFLRPSATGGVVVQLASSDLDDARWAREVNGFDPEPCPDDAAQLHEVVLGHPGPEDAAALWATLGATVTPTDGSSVRCRWAGSPLGLHIQPGPPGPRQITVRTTGELDTPLTAPFAIAD